MTNSSSLLRTEVLLSFLTVALAGLTVADLSIGLSMAHPIIIAGLSLLSFLGILQSRRTRRAMSEMAAVMAAASAGDLERRIVLLGDGGDVRRLADNINDLLDNTDAFVRESRATLNAVRDGLHHRRIIQKGMRGVFRVTAGDMNAAVTTIDQRLNDFASVIDDFETTVGGVTGSLAQAVQSLSQSAESMRINAVDTEERSVRIGSQVEETTATLASVSESAEELTFSAHNISNQSALALDISQTAEAHIRDSQDVISGLMKAVGEIVEVIDLIRSIAEQTKLLALNATIEAARAGEDGRGFHVVAVEVKALAAQTAAATDTISERIRAVEDNARQSMNAISGVTDVFARISAAAKTISTAVQDQAAATQQISASMQMATCATDSAATEIGSVATAASATEQSAGDVANASDALASHAEKLRLSVSAVVRRARVVAGRAA